MTYKEKYEDLDRSKLPEKALAIIDAMKEDTDGFTDKEAIEVVGDKFDAVLAKLKASGYENAFKSLQKKEPEPKTPVAQAQKVLKKNTIQPKTTSGKPKVPPPNKGEIAKLAKEIRKDGEPWLDALRRAGEIFREQRTKTQKKANAQYKKLTTLLNKMPNLGKGTDVERDAPRKAKAPGKRISKDGNTYYESRANRSDVRQGKGYPYLELGGKIKSAKRLAGAGTFSKGGEAVDIKQTMIKSKKHKKD